jgi:hypothetical protein
MWNFGSLEMRISDAPLVILFRLSFEGHDDQPRSWGDGGS